MDSERKSKNRLTATNNEYNQQQIPSHNHRVHGKNHDSLHRGYPTVSHWS